MSHDFSDLEKTLMHLSAKLEPTEQRRINRAIAMTIRRSQAQRIARQMNPDGTAYEPRKNQQKRHGGRIIRGQMFKKIRTNRWLRQLGRSDEAVIYFASNIQNIVKSHHYGLPEKHGDITILNTQRELLGLTKEEETVILRAVVEHLSSK